MVWVSSISRDTLSERQRCCESVKLARSRRRRRRRGVVLDSGCVRIISYVNDKFLFVIMYLSVKELLALLLSLKIHKYMFHKSMYWSGKFYINIIWVFIR